MPTVIYKCPETGKKMKEQFPYNVVGKVAAGQKAIDMKGTLINNPGYGMEKDMSAKKY